MKNITYNKWILPMRQQQISVVSLLTALLYVIASIIDGYLVSKESLPILRFFHLYTIVPSLLSISYLAYTEKYPKLLIFLVMIAPIYAAFGNIIIMYYIDASVIYFSEIFLIIFWIFTVSGLNLKEASFSAFVVILMTSIYLYLLNPYDTTDTVMSLFWILASTSFGLIAAILLNTYSREIYSNFIELQTISKTDKLTGLYNRVFVDKDFKVKLHFTQKNNIMISMIMIDIDDFKEINDTYGHHIGDDTLVQISHLINNYSDDNNIVIRWGGEEFLIIKIDTNKEKTRDTCEAIRKDIESHKFSTIESSTVSIGYSLSKDMDTFDLILDRADAALYTAKKNGKNRVESL